MTKPITLIANWKMQLTLKDVLQLAGDIEKATASLQNHIDVVLCPSFPHLASVRALLRKASLGAQDTFWEARGAFTGEVSPVMLKELGCQYVIIGHSERREYVHESDAMIHKKMKAALQELLIPIVCVGESSEERRTGRKDFVIIQQVTKALQGIQLVGKQQIIVAYEPVWVIGTGQAIAPEDAEHMHRVIHQTLIDLFPIDQVRRQMRIVYGGSVNRDNIVSFLQQKTIDGVLVGGASLRAKEFIELLHAATVA